MSRAFRDSDPEGAEGRPFELREEIDAEGVTVELRVDGECLFSGRVLQVDLAEMVRLLRVAREDVVKQLQSELVARFERERADVGLTPPALARGTDGGGHGDKLVSRYVIESRAGVEAGIAWYDVSSRTYGPDHVPLLVRSRMREAVHRKLTETRPSTLGVLLDVLEDLSS